MSLKLAFIVIITKPCSGGECFLQTSLAVTMFYLNEPE